MDGVPGASSMLSASTSHHHYLRSSDDNLVLSTSLSASKMNDLLPHGEGSSLSHQVQPRLSKSEENLIDLDTPDGLGFELEGYTLENPLYELLTDNNNVFLEDKTDAELLSEYGLTDYFAQMNMSNGSTPTPDPFNTSANSSILTTASTTSSSTTDPFLVGPVLTVPPRGKMVSQKNGATTSGNSNNSVNFGASWATFD